MAGKKVAFGTKPTSKPASLDEWVGGAPEPESEATSETVPMKRLTFDIPADLHRRIKVSCAERGTKMAEEIRDLLEKHFSVKA